MNTRDLEVNELFQIIFDNLPQEVVEVVVTYSGYGDQGGIETIEYDDGRSSNPGNIRVEALGESIDRLVERLTDKILEERKPGWECDDGSCGTVTYSRCGEIYIDHNWRVTITENDYEIVEVK